MGDTIRRLKIEIVSSTQQSEESLRRLSGDVDKTKSKFKSLDLGVTDLIRSFGGLIAIGGAIGMVGNTLKLGVDFQAQMSMVGAATGKGKDAIAELSTEARRLGATTTFSATEAAQAMTELAKAGLDNKQIMVATNGVLNLAGAGELALAEAATIASDTMSGFGLKAEDVGRISDVLAKGANASTISVQMMGETFKYVSGVAKAANVSLEETAAMTAIMGNAGIKGSMAGTSLKAMLLQLSAPTTEATKAMKSLGLNITDSHKNMLPISQIMGDLQTKMAGMGNTEKLDLLKTIFGSEPAAGVLSLIDQGADGINKMTEVMKNSGGSAKEFARQANDNIKGMLKSLNSIAEEIQLKIFDVILPMINPILSFFTDSNSGMQRVQIAAILLGSAFTAILIPALYSAAIAGYVAVLPWLPFIGIVVGVAAGVTLLYLLFEDFYVFLQGGDSMFGDFLSWMNIDPDTIAGIREFMNTMIDGLKIIGAWIWEYVKPALIWIGKFFAVEAAIALGVFLAFLFPIPMAIMAIVAVVIYLIKYWDDIKLAVAEALTWMLEKITQFGAWLFKWAVNIAKMLIMTMFPVTIIYFFWDEIKEFFAWLWSKIEDIPLVQKFVSIGNQIWQTIKPLADKLASIFNPLIQPFIDIYNKIQAIMTLSSGQDKFGNEKGDIANQFAEMLSSSGVSDERIMAKPANLVKASPNPPAKRAEGGNVEAGVPYMINEKGSEVVTFGANGYVTPNSALQGSSGGGNSSTVVNMNISIQSAGADYDAFALFEKFKELISSPNNQAQARAEMGLSPA